MRGLLPSARSLGRFERALRLAFRSRFQARAARRRALPRSRFLRLRPLRYRRLLARVVRLLRARRQSSHRSYPGHKAQPPRSVKKVKFYLQDFIGQPLILLNEERKKEIKSL